MASPLPLQQHPLSGLEFPWAFTGDFNMHLGDDGVGWAEVMQINWGDLQAAVQAILGYSWRDTSTISTLGVSQLRRKLPWQHPYFNQLWVKNITKVEGIRMMGTNQTDDVDDFIVAGGGAGLGVPRNLGPWTEWERANITIQFWRPPYFVRSDEDIVNEDTGLQQEWLRYVDRRWSSNTQILSREGSQFVWSGDPNNGYARGLPGSVGQVVQHSKVTRTWYQVPEAAIFATAQDATPNGQATNLLYSQTTCYNPITGYKHTGGGINPITSAVNVPIGANVIPLSGTSTAGSPVILMTDTGGLQGQGGTYGGDAIFGTGIRTAASVVSVVANTSITISLNATQTGSFTFYFISDYDPADRLFGCYMGTLRYDHADPQPQPLQLPPYLMQIPLFANNEAISQVQYNVVLSFDIFDPPRPQTGAGPYSAGSARGHNLLPWAGTGLWYPANSRNGVDGTTNGPYLTIHPYADLTDLFQIL